MSIENACNSYVTKFMTELLRHVYVCICRHFVTIYAGTYDMVHMTDIIRSIRESKHRWAGHVARRRDNRWTIRITEWIPRGNKRPRGRPRTRWCDDLIQYVGPTWSHIARDRKLWQACREGFLLRERETP